MPPKKHFMTNFEGLIVKFRFLKIVPICIYYLSSKYAYLIFVNSGTPPKYLDL